MTDKVLIPFNDVFFYGLSLNGRETSDVKLDIFANIMMRYLRTLAPVSSRLYRTAEGNKYEYNYSFIPSKPLFWRVIKNRRIIEEIEQLSDGKYCLNYYDDQGHDVKRVHFNRQHKWIKTNYYNSLNADNLIYSLVPKEINNQTALLLYPTGVVYPTTLYCCPVASCEEVQHRVLERCPEPQVSALTNYGVLYFADEETLNIYNSVLAEEEQKYEEEHRPEVYTTDEDVAGGFCFSAESFDSTKGNSGIFNLSEAQELTDDGFFADAVTVEVTPEVDDVSVPEVDETAQPLMSFDSDEPYSLEAEIAEAIKIISESTAIEIDKHLILNTEDTDDPEPVQQEEITEEVTASEETELVISETEVISRQTTADNIPDEDIDDYVRSLIDNLLTNAKEAVSEYTLYSEEGFADGASEVTVSDNAQVISQQENYVESNTPDEVIDSNGESYFYYGGTDAQGRRTGKGRTLMSDGKTAYEGDYLCDKRHGKGSFYYKSGDLCYWGDWQNNLRSGFGVGVSSETGRIHIGNWHNNKPTGVGVRFDRGGNFLYIDSACERVNGGIRVTGFTENTLAVEFWDEKSLKIVKKEISIEDLI